MSCPQEFYNKHIDIPTTFDNHLFFEKHVANDWNFEHFVTWKGYDLPLSTNTVLQGLLKEYQDGLNALLKKKILHRDLQDYLGRLKRKYNARRSAILLDIKQQSPPTTIITQNMNTGNFYGTLSGNVETVSSSQQQEQSSSSQRQQHAVNVCKSPTTLTSLLENKRPFPHDEECDAPVDVEDEQGEAEPVDKDELDDYQIPSDITIEYHGQRTSDFHLENLPVNEQLPDEGAWIIVDQNISHRCYAIKSLSIQLQHKATNMGDLRLLALNDIYLIGNDLDNSITKYFEQKLRRAVLASIDFDMYMPPAPEESQRWCFDVAQQPPTDFVSAVSFAHNVWYLPLFHAQPPPCNIEDSYVHHYLAPIFQSVFASNSHFKVNWANTQIVNDHYKPDLLVSATCGSFPLAIVVGEFKSPLYNSNQTESDQVKLGKEMRSMINDLVVKGTPDPAVCGVLVQGFDMSTFVMDLPSPKLYRLVKLSNLTMFKTLDQICNLPLITTRLVQLANIASNTVSKAEAAILSDHNRPRSQLGWISQERYSLTRKPPKKKQRST
ncbi:hypothetical protein DFQ30_008805 [Apophysomyces sp. BC1015]|nr:hypothetical protein DFQ30_008805 [Apophysomyces sp. BC1015]